jgi:hypothetical protein
MAEYIGTVAYIKLELIYILAEHVDIWKMRFPCFCSARFPVAEE